MPCMQFRITPGVPCGSDEYTHIVKTVSIITTPFDSAIGVSVPQLNYAV